MQVPGARTPAGEVGLTHEIGSAGLCRQVRFQAIDRAYLDFAGAAASRALRKHLAKFAAENPK